MKKILVMGLLIGLSANHSIAKEKYKKNFECNVIFNGSNFESTSLSLKTQYVIDQSHSNYETAQLELPIGKKSKVTAFSSISNSKYSSIYVAISYNNNLSDSQSINNHTSGVVSVNTSYVRTEIVKTPELIKLVLNDDNDGKSFLVESIIISCQPLFY